MIAVSPATEGCARGGPTAQCEHMCEYGRRGQCWKHGCPVECPSEWCPMCTGEACVRHPIEPCDCDCVDRHETEAEYRALYGLEPR